MGALLAVVLLLGDAADDAFVAARIDDIRKIYEQNLRVQTVPSTRARAACARELGHIPCGEQSRSRAGLLLAEIFLGDRTYRVRAEAARSLGRVGTAAAIEALYRGLFLPEMAGNKSFELLDEILPEALELLRSVEGLEWIGEQVLAPAAGGPATAPWQMAGPLRERMLLLTLEGLARGRATGLGVRTGAIAAAGTPQVRAAALRALARMDFHDPILTAALGDPNAEVRAAAASWGGHPAAAVAKALADPSERVRRAAVRSLENRDGSASIDLLIDALDAEKDPSLVVSITDLLHRFTGREFLFDAPLWRQWWEARGENFRGPEEPDETGATRFFDVGVRGRRILFVIDCSGSMQTAGDDGWTRLNRAGQELMQALAALPPVCTFALLAYSSDVARFPESGDARPAEAAAPAVQWLCGRKPSGATNTYGALMRALADPSAPDTIVLLSDGTPFRCSWQGKSYSEPEQILAEVRRANPDRAVRIHTVALLSGAFQTETEEDPLEAADFLRRLARDNGGQFVEVN